MREVINSILEAESKAEEIIQEAVNKSNEVLIKAEREGETYKSNAIDDFKMKKKQCIKNKEAESEKLYSKRLSKAKSDSDKISEQAESKINELVNNLVSGIID